GASPRNPSSALNLANEDEGDHERVDRDRFCKAEADEQWHQDGPNHLWIATDRFHGLADAVTDADARTDRPETNGEGRRPNIRGGSCRGCLGEETELKHARTSSSGVG